MIISISGEENVPIRNLLAYLRLINPHTDNLIDNVQR